MRQDEVGKRKLQNKIPTVMHAEQITEQRRLLSWYLLQDYPSVKMNQNLGIADPGMDVQDDHKVSIRKLGAASVVLLRNQNQTLPITSSVIKFIAVIGEDAKRDPKQVAYKIIASCLQKFSSNCIWLFFFI